MKDVAEDGVRARTPRRTRPRTGAKDEDNREDAARGCRALTRTPRRAPPRMPDVDEDAAEDAAEDAGFG